MAQESNLNPIIFASINPKQIVKKFYKKPTLTNYGTAANLTKACGEGNTFDATFGAPVGSATGCS